MTPTTCTYCGKTATEAGRLPNGVVPRHPNVCSNCKKMTTIQSKE